MLTNKEKVAYLKQYKELGKEIAENENRYEVLKNKLISPGVQRLTDMPRGTDCNKDKICDGIAELEELMHDRINRLTKLQKEIEKCIDKLSDSNHRRVMAARYIDGKSFEKVAADMSYSWQHIHRIHSDALISIEIQDAKRCEKMRVNERKNVIQ